jgi:hypothetical protein
VIPVILPGGDYNLIDNFLELRTWVDFGQSIEDERGFHLLLSGIRGLPPGRYIPAIAHADSALSSISQDLFRLKELRRQQLIDDEIALEYQRRLLDKLVGFGGSGSV